jgi:hypothetical protein
VRRGWRISWDRLYASFLKADGRSLLAPIRGAPSVTRLRIPERLSDQLPAGDYEVLYVSPAAGVLQIARTHFSLGQKDKPEWRSLQRHAGVRIECDQCRDWFEVTDIPLDEVRGWRCPSCNGSLADSPAS